MGSQFRLGQRVQLRLDPNRELEPDWLLSNTGKVIGHGVTDPTYLNPPVDAMPYPVVIVQADNGVVGVWGESTTCPASL